MSKKVKAIQGLKKLGSYVKMPFAYAWRHKKKVAVITGVAASGAAAAMYAGYLPTPEVIQSAIQVASTTVAEHPTESLAAGSAAGGIVGWAALKKSAKGAKKLYGVAKTAKKLAGEAAGKAGNTLSGKTGTEGGTQPSQPTQGQLANINWEKAKFFVPET